MILAALSFGELLSPKSISVEGITHITAEQTAVAESFGCAIKLIGHTERIDGRVLALVAPHMVPAENPVHHVTGVFNGILVDANMLGRALFYGAGAGKLPTASAVVADILSIASGTEVAGRLTWKIASDEDMADVSERVCRRLYVMEGCAKCADKVREHFGFDTCKIDSDAGTFAFISRPMSGKEAEAAVAACKKTLVWSMPVLD